jgi:hypothetical protein
VEVNIMAGRFEVKDSYSCVNSDGFETGTGVTVIVDKQTGVNYLMIIDGMGRSITPLLDADGKPIVTK